MKKGGSLPISEMFYSLQGEGITAGVPAFFVRLKGCNLMCGGYGANKTGSPQPGASWICDTIDVWMKGSWKTFDEIFAELSPLHFFSRIKSGAHLIITGGEPMMHQEEIHNFIRAVAAQNKQFPLVEIETNGTFTPIPEMLVTVPRWNVSPKLSSSGMAKTLRFNRNALEVLASHRGTTFKFVVASHKDWQEILDDFISPGLVARHQVVLMPAGATQEELERTKELVADICKLHTIRMCGRMHIEIWNQKTGV